MTSPPARKRVADDNHPANSKGLKRQKSNRKSIPAADRDNDEESEGKLQASPDPTQQQQQQHQQQGSEVPFDKMDAQLISDYMARQIKRFEPDLSLVELEDRRVPASALVDTSNFDQTRDLANLPVFLEKVTGKSKAQLSRSATSPGTPHTLVIAGAGLRAAELTRSLRVYQTKTATVAKLFAKHIKLKDAVEFASKTRMSIGVGTPQRIIDLASQGALSLDKVESVVIDGTFTNEKKRSIFSMSDTEMPLTQLLSRQTLREGYGAAKVKVFIY